ncbi:hypothetical protein DDE18_01735 [Nocardioides gansuensis]|uniref:Cobalt transporter n=1 Tax=Nocardioides gansuensis TaxID=2138300 RepID=A0A2T8FFA8_9ACTN|nr:CbtA family protein [Nocardioides gansuensis]PVG84370.1 hypothetical protein DDE18_01735 [Nocardioides gansuensis]
MGARSFLVHGLLAGLVAGLLAFGVAYTVGEPPVDAAIAVEESAAAHEGDGHAHSHDESAGAEAVSREVQSTIGLATGTVAIGLVLGGLAGLLSAAALGRLGSLRPAGSTALVCALGFVSFALVPFLKYPSTPPAVGDPTTIDGRTAAFFGFTALSVVAAVGAVALGRRLVGSHGGYAACAAAAVGYLAVVVTAAVALPGFEGAGDFPADTLWEFRRASLLVLAALWGGIALVLTGLVDRSWRRAVQVADRQALAASL